jgi:hypothetical protein
MRRRDCLRHGGTNCALHNPGTLAFRPIVESGDLSNGERLLRSLSPDVVCYLDSLRTGSSAGAPPPPTIYPPSHRLLCHLLGIFLTR